MDRTADQPDEIVHQPVRLNIMAALKALPPGEAIEFVRLRAIVRATEGNLGAHLATLENAGYVTIKKDFVGKKPRTRIIITRLGKNAFDRHIIYLRNILDGNLPGDSEEKR
jgi:DNA-binding transcriptional ArsR family regulator